MATSSSFVSAQSASSTHACQSPSNTCGGGASAGARASITTKRGDAGLTDLFNGDRVGKTHLRIEALGQLDCAQSLLGKLYAEIEQSFGESPEAELQEEESRAAGATGGGTGISGTSSLDKHRAMREQLRLLYDVLRALHDAMASVATPPVRAGTGVATDPKRLKRAEFHDTLTATLEEQSHAMEQVLPKLREFILPISASSVHVARAQVRSAERWVLRVEEEQPDTVDAAVRKFLNRLSDYLFVLARFLG